MESLLPWLNENWFSLVQTLGIAASISFTGVALRRDVRARRVAQYLNLASQHRSLWSNLYRFPRLSRLLKKKRDPSKEPVTDRERAFLQLAFVHFHTGWTVARQGSLTAMEVLEADASNFFGLPVPASVWRFSKQNFESDFVCFIDSAVRKLGGKKVVRMQNAQAHAVSSGEAVNA